MNALVQQTHHGQVLGPLDTVRVIGLSRPFGGERIEAAFPAGLTVAELVAAALAGRQTADLLVQVSGPTGSGAVPAEWRHLVRPAPGTVVTFRPALHGTGTTRAILSIAVAVAAMVIAPYLAGPILGLTGAGLTIATGLIGAGIVLGGTMAINALFPVKPAETLSNETARATLNSIQGAQNQSAPYGKIPVVLGRHRQSPFHAAQPYTEIVGDDQYLRLLFCWGYGPLKIEDLKIGETPLSSFSDYEIETREGYDTDAPITLYPGQVHEAMLSIDLTENDGWNSQTTQAETDEIIIDLVTPDGVYLVTSTGAIEDYTVEANIRYRPTSGGAWTTVAPVLFYKSQDAQRRGVRIVVARDQYDVEVTKPGGGAHSDKIRDRIVWTALRSIKNTSPITFDKPLALTALRIKATGQLNGVVSTFNGVTTSRASAFDGAAWVDDVETSDPAALFLLVAQGPANARPRSDDEIDFDALEAWSAYCAEKGFTYNKVLTDDTSVRETIDEICSAGRGAVSFVDGKWSVIWDRFDDPIAQHFTQRNSWNFGGERAYIDHPHGWRVRFINADNGFTEDERVVYDDGYSAANATKFEGLEFSGVTDPDLIWKHGRYHIAQARLRPEKITISVGWDNIVCNRGDRVAISHDVLMIGLASARVKAIDGQNVTLDETVTVEGATAYALTFRTAGADRSIIRSVDTVSAGEYATLPLVGDLSGIAVGDLCSFGEAESVTATYRVAGIAHQKDLIATLTLVDDAPEIESADTGTIPAYSPHVTIPPDPYSLKPQDFRYLEAVDGDWSAVRALVKLSWRAGLRTQPVATELQARAGDGAWQALATLPWPQASFDVALPWPGVWSYRARFQFSGSVASDWALLDHLSLLGLTDPPDDIAAIRATYVDRNMSIAWDEVRDYRPVRYAIRKGASWEAGLDLGSVAHPPFAAHGDGTYLVKAYVGSDTQRTYSATAATITIDGVSLVSNVVASRDEGAASWPGALSGDIAVDSPYLRVTGGGSGIYTMQGASLIDIGRVAPARVTVTWQAVGENTEDNFLALTDVLAAPDILGSTATQFIDAYPEISFAQNELPGDVFALDPVDNPSNDIFAEADIFSEDVSFGPWQRYEPGTYVGRFFRARLVVQSLDAQIDAVVQQLVLTVDVADRVDTYALISGVKTSLNNITVPSGGLVLVFCSNGGTVAEPFNGGPGTDTVPLIQITNTNAAAYDFEVTSLTKAGCTIVPRLAGTPTNAPNTNITIQGW